MSCNIDYPRMSGSGEMEATQELHHFLLPLNPDEKTLKKYYEVVEEWNRSVLPTLKENEKLVQTNQMKPCYLALIFRKNGKEEEVCVMQSARYVRSNYPEAVIEQSHQDAKFFSDHGFRVVREKIEATAYGINGIPQTKEEAEKYKKYFEFHIKVRRKDREDCSPITESEISELKEVAVKFSQNYKIPVPLSYNKNKDKTNEDGKGHQRFLNLRFRNEGMDTIKPKVVRVREAINAETSFEVTKIISEYVWYDTYNQMDDGWIDFSPEEFKKAYL